MSTRCVHKEMKGHGGCRGRPPLLRNPAMFRERQRAIMARRRKKKQFHLV